jgi:hypothetical protein
VTFVSQRIQCLEELVLCWRDGNASTGFLFSLRLLKTVEGRKRLITGYMNSWWVALRHKDSLARYKVVMKEIIRMAPDVLCAFERGTDADWTEAISLFRAKWDDGAGFRNNTITKYLARFRGERSRTNGRCCKTIAKFKLIDLPLPNVLMKLSLSAIIPTLER